MGWRSERAPDGLVNSKLNRARAWSFFVRAGLRVVTLKALSMTVEETDRIDIVGRRPDGTLLLIVSDHLDWEDPEQHKQLLTAKINSYCDYIRGEDFAAKHPGLSPKQVVILVAGQFALETEGLAFFAETAERVSGLGVGLDFECMGNSASANAEQPVPEKQRPVQPRPKPEHPTRRRLFAEKASREVIVRRIRVAFGALVVGSTGFSVYGIAFILGGRQPVLWLRYLGGPVTTLVILYACYWMAMRSTRPALIVVLSLVTTIAASFTLVFGWLGVAFTALVFRYWTRAQSLERTEDKTPKSVRASSAEKTQTLAPKPPAVQQSPGEPVREANPHASPEKRGQLVLQLWTDRQFDERSTDQGDYCFREDLPGRRTVLMVETDELVAPVQRAQAQEWAQPDATLFDMALENFVRHHRPTIEWSELGSSRIALIADGEHAEFSTAYALTIGRHKGLTGPGGALVMMPGSFVVCSPIVDRSVLDAGLPELLRVAEVPADDEADLGPQPVYWWYSGRFYEVGIAESNGKKEVTMPEEFWSMLPALPDPAIRH